MTRALKLDKTHEHLIGLTVDNINMAIKDITEAHEIFTNISGMVHNENNRNKRSLLPLGGLFSFLFGTADQDDLDDIKKEVQTIYDNQVHQTEVLNDVISISNVSRTLINENREKINGMIQNIATIYTDLEEVKKDLQELFETRRFLLIYSEVVIHYNRLRVSTETLKSDINKVAQYLTMLNSGKLSPALIDPTHLQKELVSIQKQLPPTIILPEDPTHNVWHYYKYLSVNYIPFVDKIIMLVKIPLVDNQSSLNLFKVYNLPIYNPAIDKSVKYNIEGNSIAISTDNNYATLPSDTEFIECTLASGHFCSLKSALYHMQSSKWCLTALYLKDNDLIDQNCDLTVSNVTNPEAIYLDEGHWAIATLKSDQMEVTCTTQKHVVSLNPPLTLVKLQPACTAFSSQLKLPAYFRKFSQGFATAIKEANLHNDQIETLNFRVWDSLNVSNLSIPQVHELKQLSPAKSIPVKILKAKIHMLKVIDFNAKTKYWIFIGGGSGSGLFLFIVIGIAVYCCCCKKHSRRRARSTSNSLYYDDLVNPNLLHTKVGARKSDKCSDFGQETVGIQRSQKITVSPALLDPVKYPGTVRILNQLEKDGVDINKYPGISQTDHVSQ